MALSVVVKQTCRTLAVKCICATKLKFLVSRSVESRLGANQETAAFHLFGACLDIVLAKGLRHLGCSRKIRLTQALASGGCSTKKAELTLHKSDLHGRLADDDAATAVSLAAVHKQLHRIS